MSSKLRIFLMHLSVKKSYFCTPVEGSFMDSFKGKKVYTLTEVANSIQSTIEKTYKGIYYIKAEVIKLNLYPRTGNCYPELADKDGQVVKAQMRAVIWASNFQQINQRFQQITGEPLKEGISILCSASIEFSPKHSMALYIHDIEPSYTLGVMAQNRVETIERLKREQIFDANQKLPLPMLPQRLAIISVETSKGYSDFMLAIKKHKYAFRTQLFPSLLQGEKAIETMSAQLDRIIERQADFDCVLILRGGGSDVGLNCYDQYELAAKVATCPLPVLTGIGHSTNETITEMVAFANKISPTEVAYFLVGIFEKLEQQLTELGRQMEQHSTLIIKSLRGDLKWVESNYKLSASRFLSLEQQRLTMQSQQLQYGIQRRLELQRDNLHHWQRQVELLNPSNLLKRGFSLTYYNGALVTDATQVPIGARVTTRFYQGDAQFIRSETE